MALWSVLLPGLRRVVPVETLTRFMWARPRGTPSEKRQDGIVQLTGRLTRLRPGMTANCLERSLLAYRFLSAAGAAPQLVLGVGRADDRVVGHAWVTVDGHPIFEAAEQLNEFAPIAVFGSNGIRVGGSEEGRALPREWR
jgi:hypothetical protein